MTENKNNKRVLVKVQGYFMYKDLKMALQVKHEIDNIFSKYSDSMTSFQGKVTTFRNKPKKQQNEKGEIT